MYDKKIYKIELGKENSVNQDALYSLGIASAKTAILLNYLIQYKINCCPKSYTRYDGIKGGGLLVKGEAKVSINELGEVGILFDNHYSIGNYCRVACGKTEKLNAIKNKIADLLKELFVSTNKEEKIYIPFSDFGKLSTSDYNHTDYISTEGIEFSKENSSETNENFIEISKEEYRCLYEFLKNRSKEKTIRKYGEAAYNSMIGKVIEDQFIISAIDVIKSEIQNAEKEYQNNYRTAEEEYEKIMNEARTKFKEKQHTFALAKEEKIKELKAQLAQMKNMATAI